MVKKQNNKIISIIILLVVMLTISSFDSFFDKDVIAVEKKKDIDVSAESVILYEDTTGEIVFEKNAEDKVNPYSLSKILSAYIVSKKAKLDDKVEVPKEAAKILGTNMYLRQGEKLTVKDLLYGMMLTNANDAAVTLAIHTAKNEEDFVKLMNKEAKEMGAKNTSFANSYGENTEESYTDAKDMLKILQGVLKEDTVKKTMSDKIYNISASNIRGSRKIFNEATMLLENEKLKDNIDIKLSVGKEKSNAVARIKYDNLTFYLVAFNMDNKEKETDIIKLFEYAKGSVKKENVIKANDEMGKVWIKGGASTRALTYAKEDLAIYLPKGVKVEDLDRDIKLKEDLTAPIKNGDVVGEVEVKVEGKVLGKVPVIIKEDIGKGWIPSYIYISNKVTTIIILLIILIIIWQVWKKRRKANMHKHRIRRNSKFKSRSSRNRRNRKNVDSYRYY
ncbi:MAG: serine hydrolase [Eubacteriales bacterium]|nr:serine hydrolase [Eubacteriales bacterium]MDY3332603.1 serine hydrolase [Gallibacter sp.]